MTQAYRITDWNRRYEVDAHGHRVDRDKGAPISELRRSPLDFVRSPVFGHSIGQALTEIIDKGWRPGRLNEWAVFGIFHKLLELAADQRREYRGWILDKDQNPISAADFAKMFRGQHTDLVQAAFDLLCSDGVRWLELAEFPEKSGEIRKSLAFPETSGPLFNENETETKENKNETVRTSLDGPSEFSSPGDSASASDEAVHRARLKVSFDLVTFLHPKNSSDKTTIRDIFNQLEQRINDGLFGPELFNEAAEVAKHCRGARNPIAMFIEAMKRPPFNYTPVHRRQITNTTF